MIINTVYNEDGEFMREEPFDADVELDKLYPTEQTNEEWFCGLSTEEKARWLENKMTWAAQEQGTLTVKGWEMWLKQPHIEE